MTAKDGPIFPFPFPFPFPVFEFRRKGVKRKGEIKKIKKITCKVLI
jgi:hypothetical protein